MLSNAAKQALVLGLAVVCFITALVVIVVGGSAVALAGIPAGLAAGAVVYWWARWRPGGEGRLSDQLWRLDDKAYESRGGWLMPGGIGWKLGRRDDTPRERLWPYLLNLTDGWFYNAARERTVREKAQKDDA